MTFTPRPFPSPRRGSEYDAAIYRWLIRSGLAYLLTFQRAQIMIPTVDDLDAFLFQLALDHGGDHIVSDYDNRKPGPSRITTSHLEDLTRKAAGFAVEHYNPHFLEWASKGGRASARKPKFTLEMLSALPAGTTPTEAAQRMGCSRATVYNILSRAAETVAKRKVGPSAADLEALLASMD